MGIVGDSLYAALAGDEVIRIGGIKCSGRATAIDVVRRERYDG